MNGWRDTTGTGSKMEASMRPYRAPAACCVVLMLAAAGVFVLRAAAQPAPRDGIAALLRQLERTAAAADAQGILALGAPAISRPIFQEFARSLTTPAPTRVVVNERDRAALEQGAQRLIVEVFSEHGIEGRLGTWRVDVQPGADSIGSLADRRRHPVVDRHRPLPTRAQRHQTVRHSQPDRARAGPGRSR